MNTPHGTETQFGSYFNTKAALSKSGHCSMDEQTEISPQIWIISSRVTNEKSKKLQHPYMRDSQQRYINRLSSKR